MKKTFVARFLLVIVLVVMILPFSARPVSAAVDVTGTPYYKNLKARVDAYLLYKGLASCLTQNVATNVTGADIDAGRWDFDNDDRTTFGYLSNQADGDRYFSKMGCDGEASSYGTSRSSEGPDGYNMLAMKAWGITDVRGFICSMVASATCFSTNGEFITPQGPDYPTIFAAFKKYSTKYTSNYPTELTPAENYVLARETIFGQCHAELNPSGNPADPDIITFNSIEAVGSPPVFSVKKTNVQLGVKFATAGDVADINEQTQVAVFETNRQNEELRSCGSLGAASGMGISVNDSNAQAFLRGIKDDKNSNQEEVIDQGDGVTCTTPSDCEAPPNAQKDCEAGELGWLFCSFYKAIRGATDTVSGLLDGMLETEALTPQVQSTWASFRNVANVLFAIAFMIVIFSQATSIGIGAYGIKRLLPRIIAAVILVNISFFFCQVAIDISNVTGNSMTEFVNGTATGNNLGAPVVSQISDILSGVGGTILTGVGIVVAIIFFLTPILVLMLVTFFVIALRTALVILLTVVAPIAFVAWILPNTEKWFKKWLEVFVMMLALYPLVMATFAIATAASQVIARTEGLSMKLIALVIQALPLFALPTLFKLSGSALSRIGDITQRVSSPLANKTGDTSRKLGGTLGNSAKLMAGSAGSGVRKATNWGLRKAGSDTQLKGGGLRRARISVQSRFRAVNMAAEGKKAQKEYDVQNMAVDKINDDKLYGKALRAQGGQRFADAARAEQQKQFAEGVSSIRSRIDTQDISQIGKILENAIRSGDHQSTVAAMESLGTKGGAGNTELARILRSEKIQDKAMQSTVKNTIQGNSTVNQNLVAKAFDVGKATGYDGSGNLQTASLADANLNQLSTQTADTLRRADGKGQITKDAAREVFANDITNANLGKDERGVLNTIATR